MPGGPIDSSAGVRESERGVSEVLGVVFMVGITVIIAAVVGVFALGLSQEALDGQPPVAIGVESVDASSDEIVIEQDGGSVVSVDSIDVKVRVEDSLITFPASAGDGTRFEPADVLTIDTDPPSVDLDGSSVYSSFEGSPIDVQSGDTVTVTIVDADSGTILAERTFLV